MTDVKIAVGVWWGHNLGKSGIFAGMIMAVCGEAFGAVVVTVGIVVHGDSGDFGSQAA